MASRSSRRDCSMPRWFEMEACVHLTRVPIRKLTFLTKVRFLWPIWTIERRRAHSRERVSRELSTEHSPSYLSAQDTSLTELSKHHSRASAQSPPRECVDADGGVSRRSGQRLPDPVRDVVERVRVPVPLRQPKVDAAHERRPRHARPFFPQLTSREKKLPPFSRNFPTRTRARARVERERES